ncbi:C4-dicarboxylate transporter/malic acid transport family protein [Coccidioides posadasii C735 delta SOWgp]|uniref:Sulfite efflux pump SSU1 n=2 Tax=Coccidioides posadasii TaxID=199306 RepID=E9DGA2_COCPS|nr:C4-dicarboxylate transporter/malic acid transport family protein [Coccidioides posadasii C735 delta SOWgp]EER24782.1 C4-dicarboxylate transporter/malic acid transport family protein [Coccidioides posadasii C735 delta SOWgp]EFW14593.1 C4-dicarboxylate/malic acid transporter [Coccidioides posadasii str. Silveira]|eukprot:XP_003066927.1 C4-dicarboxylate transporter/malic acid transport family protein [Coccidioides posadasii C735 delta SOWgp]
MNPQDSSVNGAAPKAQSQSTQADQNARTTILPPTYDEFPDEKKARRRDDWIAIANFHPGWFAANMGTGITAILLERLPFQFPGLHYIAVAIFILNIALFTLFLAISIVRYGLWPEKFKQMLAHPAHSMMLGTFPMGFATIINLTVFICVPMWGDWAATMAWIMWWIDAAVSIFTCYYVPFVLTTVHPAKLETMTAAWLLPIVAPVVAAASGGVVAEVLPNDSHAMLTVIFCYIMWGSAVPFAMVIIVIYFQRLALHKVVPSAVIVSTLLPVGPLGQGGFGIMQLGIVAKRVFPTSEVLSPLAGEIFYAVGVFIALVMWGFGLVWLWFAAASFARGPFPFNLGWWAFTFPIGVFTTACTLFGKEFNSVVFNIIGTILSVCVTLLWIMVFGFTIWKSCTKELFRL